MEDRTRASDAYAVLTDAGELVFFRSEESYETGKIARVHDVMDVEHEGVVFAGVETEQWSIDNLPDWYFTTFSYARIADGQAIAPVSCSHWFKGQYKMVGCDLEGLNTSKVTDMSSMFECCESLVAPPDTSRWDTSSVTDMKSMFYDCTSLTTPPDTSRWDTSNVKDMSEMFWGCESLVAPPDTSAWDTSEVENTRYMFYDCESLATPPNTSKWDTSSIRFADNMFTHCRSFDSTPPDISSLNDPIR